MGAESRQLTTLKAVKALLEAGGGPAGLTVLLDPPGVIWQGGLPAIGIYPAITPEGRSESVDFERMAPRVRRILTFRTEIRAIVGPAESGAEIIDPLYVWVVQQLGTVGSVSGVVRGPHEQGSADGWLEEGEFSIKVKAVEWQLQYDTRRDDPTEAP